MNFTEVYKAIVEWQLTQFGTAEQRGPVGPLRHLVKEANEAIDSFGSGSNELGKREVVDCLFLTLEASWRSGMTLPELIELLWTKLRENRARSWPAVTADQPVEHVREAGN